MSAIRLPLLYAFAGGCLSNAVLFGVWRAAEGSGASAVKQQHQSHNVVELVTAATAAPSVEPPSELVAANAAEHGHDAATEPAPAQAAQDLDSSGATPGASAVSDVLTRLEAAYRERVAARAPAQGAATQDHATAAAPADNASTAPEPARGVPAQPDAEVIPVAPAVVAAAPIEHRAIAPAPVAPAPVAPQIAAEPAFAAQDTPRPSEIHYGDVNQNTYVTNIRQGDVYLIQMQQLAMLQYMQLLGTSSSLAAPARHVGGAGPQRARFPSGITNPDNPWGFRFAPPNLVR